jgi:hypothetical protein
MAEDQPRIITRRELLRGAAVLGAAAASGPAILLTDAAEAAAVAEPAQAAQARARAVFENLTADESDILEAIVARLIPNDALGPGAKEAGAARYIDRALGGALSASRKRELHRLEPAELSRCQDQCERQRSATARKRGAQTGAAVRVRQRHVQ